MSAWIRAGICTVLLAGLAGGGVYARREVLPEGRTMPGVRVEGAELPPEIAYGDDAAITAWIEGRVAARLDRSVEIHVADSTRKVTLRDVLAPFDAALVVTRVRSVGRVGTLPDRVDEALRARRGEIDVPFTFRVDEAKVEAIVASLEPEVATQPVDARLDLAKHGIVHDHEGRVLPIDATIAALSIALVERAKNGELTLETIELSATPIVPHVTESSLAKLDISTVLASFETHFGRFGDQAPRAANIENAARKLDGLVMEPGVLVSFNQVVGERSEANGFKMAWEIFKGEMRPGVGGGTCQVASTFHAASLFAGLDIVERLPHSRPSAYIPMGLDATVVYPVVDLKLRNPNAFPVVVHTAIKPDGQTLVVEILGKTKPVDVAFARDVVETFPYQRRIDEEPWVAEGKTIKKQGGIRGYRVRRVRTLKPTTGGPSKSEVTLDFYPPTVEIWVVPVGYDQAELPAMPDDVLEALAKKRGETLPAKTDAVACAGECGGAATTAKDNAPRDPSAKKAPAKRDPSAPYD